MLDGTLLFAKHSYSAKQNKRFDIISLIESICDDLADIGHEVKFNSSLERKVMLGDPILFKRAFANVINNAVKYGNSAKITITQQNDHLVISIDDNGSGIAPADMENVFEPFYRADPSRNKETGGVGLGLAIAKTIINAYGGSINLENLQSSGLRVIITF